MQADDGLTFSDEEMRALGYRVIDLLVEHFGGLRNKPVTQTASPVALAAALREALPEQGADPFEVLGQLQREVFGNIMHLDHPRFFAFVPSPSNFVSVMADTLASGFNVFAGTWLEASGPAEVELVTVQWLSQLFGLPPSAGGLFVSGGSVANLTALAVARHIQLRDRTHDAVVYCSDQTHSSVDRALRLLGFTRDQLRYLPSDEGYRLDLRSLHDAVRADRSAGRRPFCVVANAGTTNTGAVDPVTELSSFCRAEELWLHVDGAYGAAATLCPRGRSALGALADVDSLVLDPHKWLFQPYEIGCVLVRDGHWLDDTFRTLPEYLRDAAEKSGEVNFCDRGIQLTRGFRALKLWLSFKVFGRKRMERAIDHGIRVAETVEAALRGLPSWRIVTPAQLGIVTFRYEPSGRTATEVDALNRSLVEAVARDGFLMLSSTELRGRTVLRMCTINPRTTDADIRESVHRLDHLARSVHEPRGVTDRSP